MQIYDDELLQIRGHLYNLVNQVEQMQWEVARLSRETQSSNGKITALTRHLIHSETQTHLHEKLAEFVTQLETSQEKIDTLSEPQKRISEKLAEFMTQLETSGGKLDDLSQTVKKLSRTQFKSNALSESKEKQVSDTLSMLRELFTKREELKKAQQVEEQQHVSELQAKARGELAADFLPVLDGIEMALEHRIPHPEEEHPHAGKTITSPGFFQRFFRVSAHTTESSVQEETQRLNQETHKTIAGWLRGLEIVRERFLSLLAREGIEPIPDLNEQFDPHLHVAVETEERTDVPENTIVSVIRKGYILKDRVLRYSEVIVARPPQEKTETTTPNGDDS